MSFGVGSGRRSALQPLDLLLRGGINPRRLFTYKAKRNKPLVNWQVWFNKTASSIRVGVERANATMKNWYGMEKVRYLGLDRNNCHLQFVAMAMNMKRAMVLHRGDVSRREGGRAAWNRGRGSKMTG